MHCKEDPAQPKINKYLKKKKKPALSLRARRIWSLGLTRLQTHKEIKRGKEKGAIIQTATLLNSINSACLKSTEEGKLGPYAVRPRRPRSRLLDSVEPGNKTKQKTAKSLTNKGRKEMSAGKPKTCQAEHRVASVPTTQPGRFRCRK